LSRSSRISCDWRGCGREASAGADELPHGWAEFTVTLKTARYVPEHWQDRMVGGRLERTIVVCSTHASAVAFGGLGPIGDRPGAPELPPGPVVLEGEIEDEEEP
jgi:hypothetical protein